MRNLPETFNKPWDVAVIGSGMASLTAAALLARDGKRVLVLEQNYLPGGCTSAYYRKGFVFEAGATTLVGLDEHMPLKHLLDRTGIEIPAWKLDTPMKVYLPCGEIVTRYQDLDAWIAEAERVFGAHNQRPFWEYCHAVSQFVWETSLKQRTFPPSKLADFWPMARAFEWKQLRFASTAFTSMRDLLQRFDLLRNERFVQFVNEQLLITAQNHIEEVNVLFGGTALCYTNFGNYYVKGGLINLVQPICDYIEAHNGAVLTRVGVTAIRRKADQYELTLGRKGEGHSVTVPRLLSGIPINNTLELYDDPRLQTRYAARVMPSEQLVSAFGMGIGFRSTQRWDCLHHQIHLRELLPHCASMSIFVSLNHPDDDTRTPEAGYCVANVSTHVHDPAAKYRFDKSEVEAVVLATLEERGFLRREDVVYTHAYQPASWEDWIGRKYGFVGGYPQYMRIKPWQMLDARLDHRGAYICGDTTYPGQGIPGTALSGIIAYEKMVRDGV